MVYSTSSSLTVPADTTVTISETTSLSELIIESGGNLVAPTGYSLTLTVDGVETGQELETTTGVDTVFVAGTYSGTIVLTVTETNSQTYSDLTFPLREALYLDADGIDEDLSVLSAVVGGTATAASLEGFTINSTGMDFNGIFVAGGSYEVNDVNITLDGDGRSDMAGYGTAVVGTGTDTTLVLDGVNINTHGVTRTGVIASGGSNVIVKNSNIATKQGTLPSDYVQTVDQSQMRSVPWMLGINGTENVRSTNLIGTDTKAAYINSKITSDGWGVLSVDSGSNQTLTAINSTISTSGNEGYGTYAIGNPYEYLYGCTFNVGSYAVINTGGYLYFDDSSAENVAALNTSVPLGLTDEELAAITQKPTHITSDRFGVMWHSSSGTVNVAGGTKITTAETAFLAKTTEAITITIDGSDGAKITPANGIILQVMDDDDPGVVGTALSNTATYTDPYYGTTTTPTADTSFDLTSTTDAAALNLSNITLTGHCYNAIGWTSSSTTEQNMVVTLDNANLTGVISSTEAHHRVATISSSEYTELGEVTNTPRAAINNGAIVVLGSDSKWTVTATSYLTSLTLDSTSTITAPKGYSVSMTVDGTTTAIVAGTTYTGAIVLTVA
ncbi:MAG: hypothetical protein H6Q74_2556 [Firmicutes bacterium]|nr:hypothetical protein [Bacillota bacterium]